MAEIVLIGSNGTYQFDPENLVNKIGQGGMGVVFKGICIENGQYVAIKVLYREITANISNIERERQSASIRLRNENLVVMVDFIEQNGIYHIISEFLEGETLHDLLNVKNGKGFSPTKTKDIIIDVLNGLNELHKNGIIHRDIDSSNIFICNDGTVKIMDFGIAKISDGKRKSLTGVGTVIGKPHYSSPEQIKGENSLVCPASDLYSLGITYYELLNGTPPFDAPNEYDLMKMQIENQLPSSTYINKRDFEIIKKATAKEINKRYQSATEFVSDLMDVVQNNQSNKIQNNNKTFKTLFFITLSSLIFIIGLFIFQFSYYSNNNDYFENLKKDSILISVSDSISIAELSTLFNSIYTYPFDPPIQISKVEFSNKNIGWGEEIYAKYLTFLIPRISYIQLSETKGEKDFFKIFIKIIKPDGSIDKNKNIPFGCTYEDKIYYSNGFGSLITDHVLTGWGYNTPGSYYSGIYTIQFYSESGEIIKSVKLRIY